ncbi:MAG: IS91 family transposase [Gammaproteobacteria bacterium]|nr:MAG: IS91 family transposase [Gammaproteobacteria bacterium]
MARPLLEVADIVRSHGCAFLKAHGDTTSSAKRRVLRDIALCRTAALGGHVDRCTECGHEEVSYNSCRNRHCTKCLGTASARWFAARESDLLPVQYFHVVFTVPAQIAEISLQNKRVMYDILMRASAQTLTKVAADPKHLGARIGFLSVLHTWGQTLMHHPHVHSIVPGGGLSQDREQWIKSRPNFFLPVKVLGLVFRGKFLEMTKRAFAQGKLSFQGTLQPLNDPDVFAKRLRCCYENSWVVYTKKPFGGPAQVLKYLARYTHRVAISNHRLVSSKDGRVSFRWKDYAHNNRKRVMSLDACEFLRRFLLHVLPRGFKRIRHYGIFANACRRKSLDRCRDLLCDSKDSENRPDPQDAPEIEKVPSCPRCKSEKLIRLKLAPDATKIFFMSRSPPGFEAA